MHIVYIYINCLHCFHYIIVDVRVNTPHLKYNSQKINNNQGHSIGKNGPPKKITPMAEEELARVANFEAEHGQTMHERDAIPIITNIAGGDVSKKTAQRAVKSLYTKDFRLAMAQTVEGAHAAQVSFESADKHFQCFSEVYLFYVCSCHYYVHHVTIIFMFLIYMHSCTRLIRNWCRFPEGWEMLTRRFVQPPTENRRTLSA